MMRAWCAALLLLALAHPASAQPPASMSASDFNEFNIWKQRYLLPDGRVIDTGKDGISHSEGQSYGLLFTQSFGDRDDFDRILSWTKIHLSRPSDRLFAWRYKEGDPAPVTDMNNATDGDIVIAWALLRAGQQWHDPAYTALGREIAAAILRLCVTPQNGRLLLLPAEEGFVHQTSTTINLSYYVFAGLRVMAASLPDPRWQQLEYDGRRVLAESQFGVWNLPPDWENLANGTPSGCLSTPSGPGSSPRPGRSGTSRGSGRPPTPLFSPRGPSCWNPPWRPIPAIAGWAPWRCWPVPPSCTWARATTCPASPARRITMPLR
jgi:endoglucanase